MEVTGEKIDNILVVRVKGRMDAVTAPEFERECGQWIDQGEGSLIVDLNQLDYISSAAFGHLGGFQKTQSQ